MTLWFVVILMAGFTVAGLLMPLMRRTVRTPARVDYDFAVYHDQLEEIERDSARGLLPADQAEAARTEIHRRMLTADEVANNESEAPVSSRFQIAAILSIVVLVPAGAMLLYARLGAPDLPDQPYAERALHDPYFVRVTQVQREAEQISAHPSAAGYKHLGDLYFDLQRYSPAAKAYDEAARLAPNNAGLWSSLGESLVLANDGAVVPAARTAFVHAYTLDRRNARAEFYLGLGAVQTENIRDGIAIWLHLRNISPRDAPWAELVRQYIKIYSTKAALDPAVITPAAPETE